MIIFNNDFYQTPRFSDWKNLLEMLETLSHFSKFHCSKLLKWKLTNVSATFTVQQSSSRKHACKTKQNRTACILVHFPIYVFALPRSLFLRLLSQRVVRCRWQTARIQTQSCLICSLYEVLCVFFTDVPLIIWQWRNTAFDSLSLMVSCNYKHNNNQNNSSHWQHPSQEPDTWLRPVSIN